MLKNLTCLPNAMQICSSHPRTKMEIKGEETATRIRRKKK